MKISQIQKTWLLVFLMIVRPQEQNNSEKTIMTTLKVVLGFAESLTCNLFLLLPWIIKVQTCLN